MLTTDDIASAPRAERDKGRAARLGARGLGHIDPGAASAAIIVETLTRRWGEEAERK